ncbi:hypothetical protein PR048_007125 [Dryococelus australis]|uniref:GSKIP domain-containing protein n=1 Tax=Dryococelus australis TaxID=614101 RepID=A0ABQ9IDR6_9NEOP|nr:hypothetical protein PR048_007125 [Dryococelus australis]
MEDEDEKQLDKKQWVVEAEAVMKDIKEHVKEVCLSTMENSNRFIYLNVMTGEGDKYCVELSAAGFRVVGNSYDSKTLNDKQYFETPYALLGSISSTYTTSFGNSLQRQLEFLEKELNV